jgi:RimJ/RimL family protein N-acetyltransferase
MTSSAPDRRAPVIDTLRLQLRPHALSDFEACFAMWSDPGVTRFIGGRPQTGEEVWARMMRYAGMWQLLGMGFWAVEERGSGEFIGEVGVMDARRDILPPFVNEPEVGWSLRPAVQGRGFAGEAVAAAIAWAEATLDRPMLVCIISPDNAPSLRLARKLGFRERLRTVFHDEPAIQLERPRMKRPTPA